MEEKVCFKCGRLLPLSEFYKHPETADKHLNKCKDCTRKDTRENRSKNIVYYKQYDRKRDIKPERKKEREEYKKSERGREATKECNKTYYYKYPDRVRAKYLVRKALRNGDIKKQCCEICGCEDVQAHHSDYTKPLDVIWLCQKHHAWIHNRGGVA